MPLSPFPTANLTFSSELVKIFNPIFGHPSYFTMSMLNVTSLMDGPYGGFDNPCILGLTNGTYPNGTLGKGDWKRFGVYMPTASEKAACQAANDPWAKSMYYGQWTVYFILSGILAVSISTGIKRLHNLNRISGTPSVLQFHPKVSALFRMCSYYQPRVWGGTIPPLGPSFLLFGFLLYSTSVCFLRRPFYRPPNYGSSPLGLRSEWVATAMVPFLYAAATKRNFLEFFAGVSFQRIMTFHKWAPWICLYMSVVHTWSMIVRANRQEPWWYTLQTNKVYWNGFPPLIALAWLCVMSLAPIRKRFYETFFICHMIAAMMFLIWMYIHLANALKSWQYMHAATVFWGAAILWRSLLYAFDHGWFRRIPLASFESLPSNVVLIRIPMPTNRTWSAGSYACLRFLSIHPWESHPFSITSLPAPMKTDESLEEGRISSKHEMVFIVRPYTGLTARLKTLAASSPSSMRACLVDGPYGGFMDSLRACDVILLIAGGTGMSALVPIAQAFSRSSADLGMTCCHTCQVHWAMRDLDAAQWFREQLLEIDAVEMYVTGDRDPYNDKGEMLEDGEGVRAFHASSSPNVHFGRPNLSRIIYNAAEQHKGRIGVMVCGPVQMLFDVRNAVAMVESRLFVADASLHCSEIELYEESFDL